MIREEADEIQHSKLVSELEKMVSLAAVYDAVAVVLMDRFSDAYSGAQVLHESQARSIAGEVTDSLSA